MMTFDFIKLLRIIEESQLDIFTTTDLSKLINTSPGGIQNYLETLSNNELITRIEKGKYCRIYVKDKYIIGSNIVENGVISHQSALVLHRIDQDIPGKVYVSSCHQKYSKVIHGILYKFIRVSAYKNFGAVSFKHNNLVGRVTDLEKTILDCLDLPRYVKSYNTLIKRLHSLNLDQEKLFNYGLRMRNLSVLKRLAFLFELQDSSHFSYFLSKVEKHVNMKYTLLDPGGPDRGPFNVKWRIRNNIY